MYIIYSENSHIIPLEFDDNWKENKYYLEVVENKYNSNYKQIIANCEIWLPINFEFIFDYSDPTDNRCVIGSIFSLKAQLEEFNKNTWKASVNEIFNWQKSIDPNSNLFLEKAKYGYSIIYSIVMFAIENKLPIKLDY